ncbi:hypothetical protein BGX31_001675 [Mortierella sp. GBA43]|nr:hypothetical protein BGX31_001675 [Mortierella sp. GBA43]
MSERDLEAFSRICGQLEILELTNVKIEDISTQSNHNCPSQDGHDPTFKRQFSTSVAHSLTDETSTNCSTPAVAITRAVRLPKLRELTLDGVTLDAEQQLEQIILHCPLLQILIWKSGYSDRAMRLFCDYLAARTWACLDWIEIKREERHVDDQDHALLLQSAPRPLRRLDIDKGSFGEQTFRLYRECGHFSALTKIDLTQSTSTLLSGPSLNPAASKQVQEVLESCPMLEHIVALVISAQDIVQGEPWVCRRLKKFEVMINMGFSDNSRDQEGTRRRIKYSEDDKILCDQIFERLGQLSQLVALDMRLHDRHLYFDPDVKLTSLPLRLRMGLGHLSTLKDLEFIGYHGFLEIRSVDMEWMLQHWKNLRKIVGGLIFVKWTNVSGGAVSEWISMMTKTLKSRRVQLHQYPSFKMFVESMNLRTLYDSGSESEGEVDGGSTE